MRRLIPIAAFALVLAVPLWAQHGGGHAGGGHGGGSAGHAGFSGGHGGGVGGGHSGGGHVAGGMRSAPTASRGFARAPSFSQRAFSNRPLLHDGFRSPRVHTYGFRNNCIGYACRGYGYPWAYGGYYDPYWWDSGSSYDNDNGYDQDVAAAAEMNRQSLEEQQMMRQEQADGDQDLYAQQVPARPAMHESDGAPVLPDTVLVFRDQHKQEIRNYAIVGQTLWTFAPQRTEKIPLSDLDLTATTKANDDRGLTFRVPASSQGQ
jgi:hypothetical protein